jgi:hypothetical protein
MKLYTTLLILLVAMCLLALASMLAPEPAAAHGVDHPVHSHMKHGGSGEARHAGPLWLNWGFGVLSILVFATLIAIGASKGKSLRGLGPWLWLTTIGCVLAWTYLVLSYRNYMTESSHSLFLALPLPSAVMLYLLLPTAAFLTLCYVVGFKRWILTEDDLATYESLLADRKRREENAEPFPAEERS